MKPRLTIAVDFDGTCVDHRFPDMGPDVPGAISVLKKLAENGHKLILWTIRSGYYLEKAVRWFVERGIPLSGINSNPMQTEFSHSPKCFADVYIDDSSLGVPQRQVPGFFAKSVDWTAVHMILVEAYENGTESEYCRHDFAGVDGGECIHCHRTVADIMDFTKEKE